MRECLISLDAQLNVLGTALEVHVAPVIQMLDVLHLEARPVRLAQPPGDRRALDFERDRAVLAWCQSHGVRWHEYVQNGVVRPVSRRGRRFREHRQAWATEPLTQLPPRRSGCNLPADLLQRCFLPPSSRTPCLALEGSWRLSACA